MRTKTLRIMCTVLFILVCTALIAVANLQIFKQHGWMINTALESTEVAVSEEGDHPSPKVANFPDSYLR